MLKCGEVFNLMLLHTERVHKAKACITVTCRHSCVVKNTQLRLWKCHVKSESTPTLTGTTINREFHLEVNKRSVLFGSVRCLFCSSGQREKQSRGNLRNDCLQGIDDFVFAFISAAERESNWNDQKSLEEEWTLFHSVAASAGKGTIHRSFHLFYNHVRISSTDQSP